MKLSTSSHSSKSSSSSPPISLDHPTMCNSKNATSGGCLSAILRRILCSGGLPTHPSDQIRELECSNSIVNGKDQNFKAKQNAEATTTAATTTTTTTTPGIVARLMGLETMGESKTSSLSRSKSMNSVDYLGECNRMQGLHKRVKSTLSFREVPTFMLLENENFLVLSFESTEGENKEFKSNGRKREMGSVELKKKVGKESGELKKNKREKVNGEKILIEKGKLSKRVSDVSCGNVGNDDKLQEITNTWPLFKASSGKKKKKKCFTAEAVKLSQPMNTKEVLVSEKLKRRKKRINSCTEKKREVECKSEDSSPVSVLDFERDACGSEVDDSFALGLSSRRKLSPELENDNHFLLRSDANLMIEEKNVKAIENNKCEGSKKKEKHGKEYIDIWGEVCRLAEDEFAGSNQIHAWMNNKQGEFGSISADFESEIFDHLLNELVDQLVGHPLTTLQLQNL